MTSAIIQQLFRQNEETIASLFDEYGGSDGLLHIIDSEFSSGLW